MLARGMTVVKSDWLSSVFGRPPLVVRIVNVRSPVAPVFLETCKFLFRTFDER
jgi:hypothetical protein